MAGVERGMAWDDLRLIHAVAENRSLPAAAAWLGLDHSTVFRRLRTIEARLGTPVFERGRDGYVPTAAGVELVALSARLEEDITTVLRRIAGQSPSPAGEVRIATSDALLHDLLLPLLPRFRMACPDIRLDIVTGNSAVNLSRRDADVAVRATARPPETLVGRKLAQIAWAAYGTEEGRGDPFAGEGGWVGFGDALAGLDAASLLRRSVPERRVTHRFDSVSGVAAGVGAGLGAGLLPCFCGDARPGLRRLSAPIPALTVDLWLLTHGDLRNVPRVRAVMDALAGHLGTMRAAIEGRIGGIEGKQSET